MGGDAASRQDWLVDARPGRGHEIGDHTADARITAWGATLPEVFEEAGLALTSLTAALGDALPSSWTPIDVGGRDLVHLAFEWLNELIGLAEAEHGAVVDVRVERVAPTGPGSARDGWRIRARAGLARFGTDGLELLRHAKGAALHGLRVREHAGGWVIDAMVDL